jgi:hypothetical protein
MVHVSMITPLFGGLTYYNMQKIVKIFHNNDMVEVQTWDP